LELQSIEPTDIPTMALFEIAMDDEKIQDLLHENRGFAALLEPILNQMLQAEMTDHLGAKSTWRTDTRKGYVRTSGSSPRESRRLMQEFLFWMFLATDATTGSRGRLI